MKAKMGVLCVGDVNLDIITSKIKKYPQKDEQITVDKIKKFIGGSSALCAKGLATLGFKTSFVARVGNDFAGEFLLKKLDNVECFIKRDKLKTATTIAITFSDGTRSFITSKGANKSLKLSDVPDKLLKNSKHLHLSGIWHLESLLPDIKKLLKKAKKYGLTTSCDMGATIKKEKWSSIFNWLNLIDILFLNEIELELLTNTKNMNKAISSLLNKVKIIGLHLGKKGGLVVSKRERISCPAIKIKVINTTGAGDAFNSGFLYSYLNRKPLKTCLKLAIKNATQYISREEQKFSTKKDLL